jgi:purine-binding chemotaxis protein CheW
MPDSELLGKILESGPGGTGAEPVAERSYSKFVVAGLAGATYAIPAASVREIVIDAPVHYVPFVPPYIRGLVNRHGEPYTAVDLNVLLRKEAAGGDQTLLVLNGNDDRLALLVSSVHEIVKVDEADVYPITEKESEIGLLAGSVRLHDSDVFIVSIEGIKRRMDEDLGSD